MRQLPEFGATLFALGYGLVRILQRPSLLRTADDRHMPSKQDLADASKIRACIRAILFQKLIARPFKLGSGDPICVPLALEVAACRDRDQQRCSN